MLNVLKTITVRGLVVLSLSGLPISQALAIETMTAERLLSSCQSAVDTSTEIGRHSCHAYIQGYLDAIGDLTLPEQADSSFQQRALQTRARGQMIQRGAIVRSPYCVPEDLSISDVVEKLESEKASIDRATSAAQLLSTILKTHFTCP